MKSKFFYQCRTLREIKQKYKELAMKHHPDRGGDNKTMQEINLEYALIINNPFYGFSNQSEGEKQAYVEFPEVIGKIIHLDLIIEVIGNWVWVSGETYLYKDHLKEIGLYFAPNKKMWYWRPREYSSNNRNPLPIEKIRALYGSDTVESRPSPVLENREGSVQ